jgi:4'-phosphopantetheinyl transferase
VKTVNEETVSEEMVSEEMVSEEMVSEETVSEPIAVDVSVFSLEVSASVLTRANGMLDDAERLAAAERHGDARRRYVVAHLAARVVLGERLGSGPEQVEITQEPNGRPRVDGVAFSLSHSGERAAVALAVAGVSLGVDLERVRVRPQLDRLAQRVFTADDYERWRALEPRARPRAFAQRWTDVESVLKARGLGIARSGASGGLAVAGEPGPGWSRAAFDAGTGFVGAVAADRAPLAVTVRAFQLGDTLTRRDATAH